MINRAKIIFAMFVAALLLTAVSVQAKPAENLGDTLNLHKQNQQKSLNPKVAAKQMLETIDKLYVTMPPGSITKENQGTLWLLKGQSHTTLHQYEEAIKSFEQAVKYDASNLSSYANIGYILNQQGKYQKSLKISDWIISKNNSFINAYINKGYSLLGLLRYQEAIDVFEKARQMDADNLTVYLGYAKGYAGLKRHDKAIEIYDGIIKYIGEGQESPQLKILQGLRKEQMRLMYKKQNP